MMKIIISVLALAVVISAAPTSITDNNVGDIVNVGIHASLDQTNDISLQALKAEFIYKNLQAIILALNGDNSGPGGKFKLCFLIRKP
jgi:large-conductance mechanosensitive channel